MDDDKELDLSLGLPCNGSSSNLKKSGTSSDVRTDTDDRTSKIVNDFKNFLNAGTLQTLQRIDPDNGPVPGDKRKCGFDETSEHKKHETETRSSDLQDKSKTSHISITTDECSTADNEDVADSEVEGSTSKMVLHREDASKTPIKEIHGKVNVGSPHFTFQPLNTLNVPYSVTIQESPSVNVPCTSGPRTTSQGNVTMSFGYSPAQLPVLDKDNSWGMVARPQTLNTGYTGRVISVSVPSQATNPSSSEADVGPSEPSKGQTKQLVAEEGSSSPSEDDAMLGRANSFPSEYPSIRPGIAADVKFGGSGNFPNLPWVSTTGPGPNGKTISGVTYKYNATQIKIVCACHGTHMTPDEFVQHAAEEKPSAITNPPT